MLDLKASFARRLQRAGFMVMIVVAAFGAALFPFSAADRTVHLETATTYTVPEGKAWVFKDLKPWSAPGEIGTADFAIKGSAAFGEEQIIVDGTFEVVVKQNNLPFTVKAGSQIEVLDSRGEADAVETSE